MSQTPTSQTPAPASAVMLVTPSLDRAALEELADEVTARIEAAVAEGIRRGLELPRTGDRP